MYSYSSVIYYSKLPDNIKIILLGLSLVVAIAIFLMETIRGYRIRKEVLTIFLILLVASIPSTLINPSNLLQVVDIFVFFIIVNLIGINPEKFREMAKTGIFFGIATVLALAALRIIPIGFFIDKLGRVRVNLGFINPNSLPLLMFAAMMLWKSQKIIKIFLTLLVFAISGSRTFLISMLIYFITDSLYGSLSSIIRRSLVIVFFIAFVILIFLSIVPTGISSSIDKVFSGRVGFYHRLLTRMTMENVLLGGSYTSDYPIDSSYVRFISKFGWISFYVMLFLFSYRFFSCFNKFTKEQISVIIATMLYGIAESVIDSPSSVISVYWWYLLLMPVDNKERIG